MVSIMFTLAPMAGKMLGGCGWISVFLYRASRAQIIS